MAESRLIQRLRSQGLSPIYEGNPVGDTGVSLIDADTPIIDGKSIRLPGGIDAPEISHLNPTTLNYSKGEVGGQELTDRTAELIEEGQYTTAAPTYDKNGEQIYGAYGRAVTNLANDQGQGLSEKLLYTGLIAPNSYADEYSKTIANVGDLERAQRAVTGERTKDDILIARLNELENKTREAYYGDAVGAKSIAATERLFDPRYHSGVAFDDRDRSLNNEIRGNQLDNAASAGNNNLWQSVYTTAGILGEVTGWKGLEDAGYGHAQRVERIMKDAGYLRNTAMFDMETGEYTLEGFTGFMDWASTNLVQSLPIMGVTMASALAAPFTWGASLSIPVSIYTGMNYNDQAEGEKDISKAMGYGVLQASLDLVGVKLGGGVIRQFFTSPAARKSVVAEVARKNNISLKDAEAMLTRAMRGQYSQAMEITKAQLAAMVKTNPQIAAGLGISIGVNGAIEGVTEGAQEALAVAAANGELNWESPEFRNRIVNALAAGGVLGGGFGALESGAIVEFNLKSGLSAATTKTLDQESMELDFSGVTVNGNTVNTLTSAEAFDWVQNTIVQGDDKYDATSLTERANAEFEHKDGFIDRALSKTRALYASSIEQELRPLQGAGPIIDRLISPFLGNRAGPTIEKERQLIIGQVADKAEFSEKAATSAMGFKTAQEFANFHENAVRHPEVAALITRSVRSGKPIGELLAEGQAEKLELTPAYIRFINQVARSNRKANKILYDNETGPAMGDGFNLLERGFSPQEIYNNQDAFEGDLVKFRGIPKAEAQRISTILTNTETIVEPQDIYAQIAGTNNSAKYAKALEGIKADGRFSKYLENNVFNNVAQNGIKLSARSTNNKYFGPGGIKIAEGLSKAVKNGDITEDVSIKAARFFRDYHQMLSGTYNIVTSRTYNRMMNVGTTYASLNLLEMAAISSFPEFATVLLHNNSNPEPMKLLFNHAKEAAKEMGNSVTELSANLTGGHVPMKEYGNNRNNLRAIGFMSEQTAPAARVGAEYSPNQARVMQMFFNAIQLNSSTNITRGMAMSMAEDAVNSFVAQAAVHYPVERSGKSGDLLPPNKFYQQAIRELDELGIPGQQVATMAYAANVTKTGGAALKSKLNEFMDIAILNYTDQRIMTPRKGNRAKWINDPRFRLIATFTGYVSTATTTLLPKIFGNLGGKDKLPLERVNAIQTIVAMMVMASLAIALKSTLRGREDEEELQPKDFIRILSQSGLTGLADRPLQILMPFSNPRTNIGDALGNVNSNLGSLANQIIGQAPVIANIDQGIIGAGRAAFDPKDNNALRNLTSTVPFADILTKERLTPYQIKEK